jgi:hypothetical protein
VDVSRVDVMRLHGGRSPEEFVGVKIGFQWNGWIVASSPIETVLRFGFEAYLPCLRHLHVDRFSLPRRQQSV